MTLNPKASTVRVPYAGLQACITMPSLYSAGCGVQGFMNAKCASYQLSHKSSLKDALFQACISMGWQVWPESGTVDTYRVPSSSLTSLSSVSLLQTALQGPQRLLPHISFSLLTANTAWTAPGNLPEDKGGSERGE